MTSPYNSFAWFYNRYWADPFQDWQAPILERLLPAPCHVLDLCCGTGQLARRLLARGYRVTGVDASPEMLRYARENAPAAQFMAADASNFNLAEQVQAAVCTFDSLNHILEDAQLRAALSCVHAALEPGAPFVCDINTDAAYGPEWDKSACQADPDHALFLRGHYDRENRRGITQITMFRLLGSWIRSDVEVPQRALSVAEMTVHLEVAGFTAIEHYRPMEDLGVAGHYGQGRVYFRSCKS